MAEKFIGSQYMKNVRTSPMPFIVDGVTIGLPFNLSDVVQKFGPSVIPDQLGIYHLFYEDHLVYIGMSRRLRGRLMGHLKDEDMPFNNVLWFCASMCTPQKTVSETIKIEYLMIKRFKPSLNIQHLNRNITEKTNSTPKT